MKILHTGDLHLGKVFHEISLLEDQKQMLNQLLAELKVDVSALQMNESLRVADLQIPAGVKVHTPGDETVATVKPVKVEAEAPAATDDATADATAGAAASTETK